VFLHACVCEHLIVDPMHDAVLHNFVRGMHDLFRNDSMQVVYRLPLFPGPLPSTFERTR
jgi:hypothetical protein